jgi:hypothetical protein
LTKRKWIIRGMLSFLIIIVVIAAIVSIEYDIFFNGNAITMVAGLWSAAATVILGIIAVWQNMRYKKLADQSSKDANSVQQELKYLNEKTMDAIETLKTIELAKYFPLIERETYDAFALDSKYFNELFQKKYSSAQINLIGMVQEDFNLPLEKLLDKYYNSYVFLVKNSSEKAIRHFTCSDLEIDGAVPGSIAMIDCDIPAGKNAVVAILNLPPLIKGDSYLLNMTFTLNNLVMDKYSLNYEALITFDEEAPSAYEIHFSFPEKA